MKLSISLPEEIVTKIDEEAKRTYNSRSSFIANACREYIASLEAKRMLPEIRAAIYAASQGKQLTDDQKASVAAFELLADSIR